MITKTNLDDDEGIVIVSGNESDGESSDDENKVALEEIKEKRENAVLEKQKIAEDTTTIDKEDINENIVGEILEDSDLQKRMDELHAETSKTIQSEDTKDEKKIANDDDNDKKVIDDSPTVDTKEDSKSEEEEEVDNTNDKEKTEEISESVDHTIPDDAKVASVATYYTTTYLDSDKIVKSRKISMIAIHAGNVVDGIHVTYNGLSSSENNTVPHGGESGSAEIMYLEKDEYINQVEVRHGKYVQCLAFVTNKLRKLGPCGGTGGLFLGRKGEYTILKAPENCMLIGIYGRNGKYIDQIGFHFGPINCDVGNNTLLYSTNPFGGKGGCPFDDGYF